MPSTIDPGEYDRSVTLTSDGTVTIVRGDGTEEQIGRLRPHLDVRVSTFTPTSPGDPTTNTLPWTVTATSDLKRLRDLPSQPDPSPGATYG